MRVFEQDEAYRDIDEASLPKIDGLSEWMLKLLYVRGARDETAIEEFFNPSLSSLYDPMLFLDMDKAVARIKLAIENQEKICIFGDYDADGICATSILGRYLKEHGAKVAYHIPSRHEHGYGMNESAVRMLAEYGIKLIITVDNGISAIEEIKFSKKLGMDVIVTDHHRCQGEIPDCVAVIAHTRPDNTYPNQILCGAGVALKLVHALGGFDDMLPYIPLAGLATIADIVPLMGENRVLAVEAIRAINAGECFPGLLALCKEAKQPNDTTPYDSRDLSFGVIPRLNAAGRMKDARPGVKLLLSNDPVESEQIAKQLTELNNLRKDEEQKIYDSAIAMLEKEDLTDQRVIVLCSDEWNTGVVGIAASRISERFYRPTLIFARNGDNLTGSARSIEGVDIFSALQANSSFLTRYGGHARAAGANMNIEDYEGFKHALNSYIRANIPDEVFVPKQRYELEMNIEDITVDFCRDIDRLAPFGEGNPIPTICIKNVKPRCIKRIGNDGAHLKLFAQKGDKNLECVAYSRGYAFQTVVAMDRCRIMGNPCINEWRGQVGVQLRVKAIAAEPISDITAYIDSRVCMFADAFYKNLLYNDDVAVGEYELVDADDCLLELINADIAGSLVLCFTVSGARRMLATIEKYNLWRRLDVRNKSRFIAPVPYNTCMLAPVLSTTDLSIYRNVLIYDSAVSTGMLEEIREMAPDAMLFVSDGGEVDLPDYCSCNRETMGRLYNAARTAGSEKINKREDLIKKMRELTGCSELTAVFALDVFCELNLVEKNRDGLYSFVESSKKVELSDSKLYAKAVSMSEMNKNYVNALASDSGGYYGT